MNNLPQLLSLISETAWKFFLPVFIILTIIIAIKMFKDVLKQTTTPEDFNLKQVVGPLAISLGSMIGTGAVIGVLAAINRLPDTVAPEAIALWSIIGLIIMLPLIYSEVITAKVMNMVPGQYIAAILGKHFAKIYIGSLFLLYIFGFDGLQYSGMASAVGVLANYSFDATLSSSQQFIFVVLPVFIFVAAILLTKKHTIFINSVGGLILSAVIGYLILLVLFMISTGDYVLVYTQNLMHEMTNTTAMVSGLPIGLLLGLQRIVQTSELGLGSIAMAASEADSKPRLAATAAIIPVVITVIVALIGTSYITSYAVYANDLTVGMITLNDLAMTIEANLGAIGLYVFLIFILLSGITTLIGSFYYSETLINKSPNINIAAYLGVTFVAGTMAIFGFSVIFDFIDLFMFIVVGINLLAITKFMFKDYKDYRLK